MITSMLNDNLRRIRNAEDSLRVVLDMARSCYQIEEDPFLKAFLVTGNRILLDSEAIRVLVRKGYYGSAWTLIAASLRTRTMIAALHLRKDLIDEFNDEEKWTHADNTKFKNKFSENNLKKIVSEHFDKEYEKKNSLKEIEQILHGSSYALKRWYSRIIMVNGLRTPQLTFKPFFSRNIRDSILSVMERIDIELIGIYYEHFPKERYKPNLVCSCGSGKKYKKCCGES